MEPIFKIFEQLKNESPSTGDSYTIGTLPDISNHKIGISEIGQPVFFIKCDNDSKPLDINLEFISIKFNRYCQLVDKHQEIREGVYTIISLKKNPGYLQEYFLKIVLVLLANLTEEPLIKDLKIEIEKLTNLFTKFSKPPLKTVQGLWAELLIIEQSKSPDYLIDAWHNSSYDRYDFNDGIDKVEVKSTTKNRRIHNFSFEQLKSNVNSKLIITSVLLIETGTGANIFDLVTKIEDKIIDKNLSFRVNEIIGLTLGKDFEKSLNVFYDYSFAVDSIQHYDCREIPSISNTAIPSNIINVRFECDLTEIKSLSRKRCQSNLHNAVLGL